MADRIRSIKPEACKTSNLGGWVYFLQEGDSGPIKIGHAWRVSDRVNCAQVGNPRALRLVGAIFVHESVPVLHKRPLSCTKALEHGLHKRFAGAHIRGEWFGPEEALLQYIESLRGVHT